MEVILKGEPKEIAALVVAIQGRRDLEVNQEAFIRSVVRSTDLRETRNQEQDSRYLAARKEAWDAIQSRSSEPLCD